MEPETRSLPRLHAIVDVDAAARAGWQPWDFAKALLDGGATLLQVRAKQLASAPFLDVCDRVVSLARPYGAAVIVNDRVDLALLSGAAGVHVGQEDLPARKARDLLGPDALIGYSTHTLQQIVQSLAEPITYVAVGPVFHTMTKDTGHDATGLSLVAEAARRVHPRPVVAIGGITLETAPQAIAAGAASVAVIGDLLMGGDPAARVKALLRALA